MKRHTPNRCVLPDGDSAVEARCVSQRSIRPNGEHHMQHAVTTVIRDGPAGQDNGLVVPLQKTKRTSRPATA